MKLILMTAFVLEQFKTLQSDEINSNYFIDRVARYANFLKQPLKLEMFIACDDEGNVLEEPDLSLYEDYENRNDFHLIYEKYQQAKEKVLFDGCSISKLMPDNYYQVYCNSDRILWLSWNKSKTVEDLVLANLTLTQSALKQIGI